MSYQDIPLLGFAPDKDPAEPGSFAACVGYESTTRGWKLARAITTVSNVGAVRFPMQGLVSYTVDGTRVIHSSILDNLGKVYLYRMNGASLTDASRAVAYTTDRADFSFSQYGNYTLATNFYDTVQIRDSSGAAAFADSAATNIPKAAIGITWGPPTAPRTMLLRYNDGTAYVDGWWSGHKGGPTSAWTADISTEAANGRLLGAGPLTCGIAFKDDAIAFSDKEMWVGTYVGPPLVVEWHKVASDIGCIGLRAACVANGILYFVGKQGLFYYDGSYPRKFPVPIQKWLVDQLTTVTNPAGTTLNIDPSGQRLLLTLTNSIDYTNATITAIVSINLFNRLVGRLDPTNYYLFLDNKYRLWYTLAGGLTLTAENTSPITTTTSYIELNRIGDDTQTTTIKRVYPRFATVPTSFNVAYAPLLAMSDTPSYTTGTAVSASPWRFEYLESAKWHAVRIYTNSNGTADPELVGLKVDLVDAGTEP